ncbi:MAG: hypothetical protein HC852_02900 [Acaryochloridaceae cyanobacterium RU_4_10]|nr:hypothetical protein [Acaryochloridaceae cyanobacterium RU_4_10]
MNLLPRVYPDTSAQPIQPIQAMPENKFNLVDYPDSDSEEEKPSKKRFQDSEPKENPNRKKVNQNQQFNEALAKLEQAAALVPPPSSGQMLSDESPELGKILVLLVDAVEIFPKLKNMPSPTKHYFNEAYPKFKDFLRELYRNPECAQELETYLTEFIKFARQ